MTSKNVSLSSLVLLFAIDGSTALLYGQEANGNTEGPSAAGYSGGGYSGGGKSGMYGAMDEEMEAGYGGEGSSPPLKFAILEGKSDQGKPKLTQLNADRVYEFTYRLGSFKPARLHRDAYGMGGGMGMGGYGGGSMEMGHYGAGSGTSSPRQPKTKTIGILAYVFDQEQVDGRTRIELVTEVREREQTGQAGNGPGAMGGGYGGPGGYDMDAYSGGMSVVRPLRKYIRLESLIGLNLGPEDQPMVLSRPEYEIVGDTIRQSIWKEQLVESIHRNSGKAIELEKLEAELKQILNEQYETQIARQRLEIANIEQLVELLKADLERRSAAQTRVVEVQLGRIVLEAQGLLGK